MNFKNSVPFDDWANAYDASIPMQKEAGLESFFRGVGLDDQTKCVLRVMKVLCALDKFMEANSETVAASENVVLPH